jgi:ParB family chromosome partitioning protein
MTTDIINIPLNKLTAWDGNVRKTQTRGFIEELAASIKAHGLQQNLIVRKDGKNFAVIAGGQRLKALQQLAKAGDIDTGHPVPCKVTAGESDATELSLAENAVRDNMHPADQFEAFRALIDKGAPAADVAARFGVSEHVVLQRLKLARVSPAILAAYRSSELNLEQVMAFAISDDHAAQENVLDNLPHHDNSPRTIREALTENDLTASDKRVKYVTLKAYEKAGGATRRDLFTEHEDGIFLLDTALLDKLLAEKLDRAAKSLRSEGWKWVEVHPDFSYEQRAQFQRRQTELAPLPAKQQAILDKLEQEHDTLLEQWHAADDDQERPERLDELEDMIDKLNDRDEVWPADTLAIAGAIVSIGHDGKTSIDRGLVRPEDAPMKTAKATSSGTNETAEAQSPAFSAALIESLTAHRSAAISAELLQRPDIALATVVHALASKILLGAPSTDNSLEISAAQQSFRSVTDSKALLLIQTEREAWGSRIPGTTADLWSWCLDQHQTVLLDLLAFCSAVTLHAVQMKADKPDNARLSHANALAATLALDMNAWFTPTSENYFSRIAKPQILEALREAKGTAPAPAWDKLKKSELATLAEREIAGKNWLPALLRRA